MREFDISIREALSKGLRQHSDQPRNGSEGLIECFNQKPSPGGLIPYEPVLWPALDFTTKDFTIHWPFPQVFTGPTYSILATEDTIYQLSLATLTKTSKLDTITESIYPWDIADFQDMFLMTNGTTMVYLNHGTIAVPIDPPTWTKDTNGITQVPLAMSYTNFKGQLICGGIQSTWYDCDENWIVWSRIGDWNCVPDKDNEAGFKKLNWAGKVWKVLRLGDHVIVYGDNGITAATPHDQTFGFTELLNTGIPIKGAVAGDNNRHVFVGQDLYLWSLDRNLKLTKLDFHDYIGVLQKLLIMVVHEPGLEEYYIGDGSISFLLTNNNLCEVGQAVTSSFKAFKKRCGIFSDYIQRKFGEDRALVTETPLTSWPNSDVAKNDFTTLFTTYETEDFETFDVDDGTPQTLTFTGVGCTLTGSFIIKSDPDGSGRYPISGSRYCLVGGDVTFTFDATIRAFGFYMIDAGDFNGRKYLEYYNGATLIQEAVIPHSYLAAEWLGAAVLFYGFVDLENPFDKVVVKNTMAGADLLALDDVIICVAEASVKTEYIKRATNGHVVSDLLDMGIRGIKTVNQVGLGIDDPNSDLYGAMDYRFDKSSSLSRTSAKPVNKEGLYNPIISGTEFRAVVYASDYTKMDLDSIGVSFKATDKRFLRGAYKPNAD